MRSIHDALRDAWPLLPDPLRTGVQPVFEDDERLAELSTRLLIFARQGIPPLPPPHFPEECTPPLEEAFAFFHDAVAAWHNDPSSGAIANLLAEALSQAGLDRLLTLLGRRQTPGSLPVLAPARSALLVAAQMPHLGDKLTVAGRALTKHSHRNDAFWGPVAGSSEEKNAAALAVVLHLLDEQTWWNVFGHPKHEAVYEVREPGGHGARWSADGRVFIGFVEPFEKEE